MDFEQLNTSIRRELEGMDAHFSVLIASDEGNLAINDKIVRPAASLAKLPILLEACRQIDSEKLHPDKLVYLEEEQFVGGSGVISYLTNCHIYSYMNLIELMIMVSDNTAANVLLDTLGMEAVNRTIKNLEMSNTSIKRKFMDTKAQEIGKENYTTASDMVTLLKEILTYISYQPSKSSEILQNILSKQQLTKKLCNHSHPRKPATIFHKTGELLGVVHDTTVLEYNEERFYIVVLSEGLTSNAEGQHIIAKVKKIASDYLLAVSISTLSN
ncbi:serine hydrolase [Oceanobacillus kapialis]|uniref:Serine hydrolase n=1 Tax=Oceanobacillus kapialis TaxID=481353 RepID=A0ABW5Q294_9BACI